ncbi:MAG TPA: hypothetical protein VG709_06420, partial [Actinomycetota bacterium]|nr:hypothetical protein [Actinomycetota bacterium]
MAEPPREDRDRRTDEDLFEDLDQFFAPLDDDWPEDEGAEPPGRAVDARSEPPPAAAEPEPEPAAEPPSADAAPADDLVDATAEMGPEWDLSDELPEAEPAAPSSQPPRPPAATTDEEDLNAADLRAPPPAYARLPGPRAEPRPADEPAARPE